MRRIKEYLGNLSIKKGFIIYGLMVLIYLIGYLTCMNYNFISCAVMIVGGIFYFFYYSLTGERSFLKFNGIFSAMWMCTLGLSQLRFLEYQTVWSAATWLNVCVAQIFFILANHLAHNHFHFFEGKFNLKKLNNDHSPVHYEAKPNRYFWIATAVALFGIICFIANVVTRGYVPFFISASNTSAYLNFYSRFHIFVVASMVSGGLSYYCIIKCELPLIKKIILGLYVAILIFIIPILLVSRGTFMIVALILTAVIYLFSKRQLWILLLCAVVMFGTYQLGSSARKYTDAALEDIFQPSELSISGNLLGASDLNPKDSSTITFKIPPKAAFLYSYITVSNDNFNGIVKTKTKNTWGLRQLEPFNVILRSKWIKEKLASAEKFKVTPALNTSNLISAAYYDFGIVGVIFFTSLWSFCFGLVEAFHTKYKGIFSCLAYGVCLTPVAMCFFYPWMSFFTIWLLFGTVFLMFLAGTFTIKKRSK